MVPAGTATLLRTIVAQAALDWVADAAPLEPLKVQVVARLSMGDAAGAAETMAAPPMAAAATREEKCMVNDCSSWIVVEKRRLVRIVLQDRLEEVDVCCLIWMSSGGHLDTYTYYFTCELLALYRLVSPTLSLPCRVISLGLETCDLVSSAKSST